MSKELKNLNVKIDERLYWEFKKESSCRKESLPEAIENAICLYLSALKEDTVDGCDA